VFARQTLRVFVKSSSFDLSADQAYSSIAIGSLSPGRTSAEAGTSTSSAPVAAS
jgi:hypothetical protein